MKRLLLLFLSVFCFFSGVSFAQQGLYEQAYEAYMNDDCQTALQLLGRLCNEEECTVSARYLAACCLEELGDTQNAATIASQLIREGAFSDKKHARKQAWCIVFLAEYAYDLQEYGYSIEFCNQAIKIDKTLSDAFYHRAYAYYMLDKNKQAEKDFKQSLKLQDNRIDSRLGLAYICQERGDYAGADAYYHDVLRRTAYDNASALAAQAKSYIMRGDTLTGTRMLLSSMNYHHTSRAANIYNNLGHDNNAWIRRVAAEELLREPTNPLWLNMMGDVVGEMQSKKDSAFQYYYQSFLLHPEYQDGFNALDRMLLLLCDLGEYAQADSLVRYATERNVGGDAMQAKSAVILYQSGRYEEAYSMLETYSKNHEDDMEVQVLLASIAGKLGRYSDAKQRYASLLERNMDNTPVYSLLAGICHKTGETEQEKFYLRKLRELEGGRMQEDSIVVSLGDPFPDYLVEALLLEGDTALAYKGVLSRSLAYLLVIPGRQIHDPAKRASELYNCACYFARMDSLAEAERYLGIALQSGYADLPLVHRDSDLLALHGRPAYDSLLLHYDSIAEVRRHVVYEALANVSAAPAGSSAHFKGATGEMERYFRAMTVYPEAAKKKKVQGVAKVQATVSYSGELEDVRLKESSGNELLDAEAVRLVEAMPAWEPARIAGRAVEEEVVVEVPFVL